MLNLSRVRQVFEPAPGHPVPDRGRAAAVAIVLSGDPEDPLVCFIQRVERPGDRWSGDMAFPGGWANPTDGDLRATAIRETDEEVGVALPQSVHLGCLAPTPIAAGGGMGLIGASLFYLDGTPPPLTPDPRELADAWWVPARHLFDPGNATTVEWGGRQAPGIVFSEQVIWGLTYRILHQLVDQLDKAGR